MVVGREGGDFRLLLTGASGNGGQELLITKKGASEFHQRFTTNLCVSILTTTFWFRLSHIDFGPDVAMSLRTATSAAMAALRSLTTTEHSHAKDNSDDTITDARQPLLHNRGEEAAEADVHSTVYDYDYGTLNRTGTSSLRSSRRPSPEVHRVGSGLNIVPEEGPASPYAFDEGPEEIELDLEERGLYTGTRHFMVLIHCMFCQQCGYRFLSQGCGDVYICPSHIPCCAGIFGFLPGPFLGARTYKIWETSTILSLATPRTATPPF